MEAAVGNETDGRRKEIADKILALAEKSELFCYTQKKSTLKRGNTSFVGAFYVNRR